MTACFWLGILCIILSIWMETCQLSIIENYAIGIACSCLVVIVTTYFQFEKEKHDAKSELLASLRTFLLTAQYIFPDLQNGDMTKRLCDDVFNQFKQSISTAQEASAKLHSVSKAHKKDWQAIATIQVEILRQELGKSEFAIQRIITPDLIVPVINTYLSLEPSDGILKDFAVDLKDQLLNA